MTAQLHERLVLDGEAMTLASVPALPETHPQIVKVDDDDGRDDPYGIRSSACWRRYIGSWDITDDRLSLVALDGQYRLVGPPLFAFWVTDILRVPRGPLRRYVHMAFESVYDIELHLFLVNGLVVDRRLEDYAVED